VRSNSTEKSRIALCELTMTESVLTATTPGTVLADYLAATGVYGLSGPASISYPLTSYLGALTPSRFPHDKLDAPGQQIGAETGALLREAAVHDVGWLRRVAIRGEDRFRWLSGMVTNAVETLSSHTGAYNLVLNAQGRIQGDVYVWRADDETEDLVLEMTAEQSPALLAHFDHFIIMDDVELVALSDQSALGLVGPDAERILATLRLPALPDTLSSAVGVVSTDAGEIPVHLYRGYGTVVPHYGLWTAGDHIPALWRTLTAAGAMPVGSTALEILRVVEGIPAYGIDIQSRDLAQETAQTRGLNFTKGCYLGQEIVERIRSRGQVHRHLRHLELTQDSSAESAAIGVELRIPDSPADAKPAGTLTGIASLELDCTRRTFAIGMVRADAEVGNSFFNYPGGTARILNSPPKLTTA
jgi:folate-binding protein YgfZ